MNAWQTIAAAVLAYLLGSVSFAWIIAKRLKGVDLRGYGSGNLGATNAGRLLGRRWAVAIYLLDFAKGFVPVALLRWAWNDPAGPAGVPVSLVAGLAAFLGHCFPVWHGFRGGKGVATASGVIVGLTPVVALIVFATHGLAILLFRRVSVASIAAAAALPLAQLVIRDGPSGDGGRWTLGFYVVLAIGVISRHHQNIRRLLKGEEPRIGATKS
jgi:acyl phosphate:glycerol-3-phosphate acyltransferase